MAVYFCQISKTLYVADTYNHKIKVIKNPTSLEPIKDWVGKIAPIQKVIDGPDCLMNEPSGLCSLVEDGEFKGIYVADTGNDCIRFVNSSGIMITP
jgi:hypothetical protein